MRTVSAVSILLCLVHFFSCESWGHHGEDEVQADGAQDGETTDVAEPELAGLMNCQYDSAISREQYQFTSKRNVPNNAQKRNGPARSESSIMCWSILATGFNTASVYP